MHTFCATTTCGERTRDVAHESVFRPFSRSNDARALKLGISNGSRTIARQTQKILNSSTCRRQRPRDPSNSSARAAPTSTPRATARRRTMKRLFFHPSLDADHARRRRGHRVAASGSLASFQNTNVRGARRIAHRVTELLGEPVRELLDAGGDFIERHRFLAPIALDDVETAHVDGSLRARMTTRTNDARRLAGEMSDTWAPVSTPHVRSGASRRVTSRRRASTRATGMSKPPSARVDASASASRASTAHHSLPELWKHAMRHYGRYQGYAWTTMLAAGGLAYALSVVMPKQTSMRSDEEESAAASDER